MKTMYGDLRDLGAYINDHTLVLNLLRGLNKKFDSLRMVLKRTKPFPPFCKAWNDLLLEELTLDADATSRSASAFTTTSGPQQQHQTSTTFGAPRVGGGCGGGGGRGGSSGGGGSSSSSGSQGKDNPSWPSFYNPWTGTINMWSSLSMGASPSRPPQHQLAFVAAPLHGPPTQQAGASSTPPLAPLPLPRALPLPP
jgi:hypothetical protein